MNKHEFRSDVRKVLNILTHSLYTNREIFLRELLSNASDALDKVRFLQSRGDVTASDLPLEIKISIDKDNNSLCIQDTGIGMKEAELVENLGTIAKSGSEEFLKDLSDEAKKSDAGSASDASQIIGRFGVGFYSVFMVADKVEVFQHMVRLMQKHTSGLLMAKVHLLLKNIRVMMLRNAVQRYIFI